MARPGDIASLRHYRLQYGEHELQRIGIWEDDCPSGLWIIFIHGGAWCDPSITFSDFEPSIKHMIASTAFQSAVIRGFISIDYRLSPSRRHPQDRTRTPYRQLRNTKHPDHIGDVQSALEHLHREHYFAQGYILVGHSAGATLAFQLLMSNKATEEPAPYFSFPLPAAIIGIAGIYDLVGLSAQYGGVYTDFIRAAFDEDEGAWAQASPATYKGSFLRGNVQGAHVLLARSTQDSLLDEIDTLKMASKLTMDGVHVRVEKELVGEHDFVWQDGKQIALLVAQVTQMMATRMKPLNIEAFLI